MATLGKVVACVALLCIGGSVIAHGPDTPGTLEYIATGLVVCGVIGLVEAALS